MVFELMSNGSVASLPQTSLPEGIPEVNGPQVVLLLPYNRYLMGYSYMRNYERWIWGKPGSDEPQEVFLYDTASATFELDDSTRVILPASTVIQMRTNLMSQMLPPGEHLPSALLLKDVVKEGHHPVFKDGDVFRDEGAFLRYIEAEKDNVLNMAYWSVRFALFRGDFDSAVRTKTWLKNAADLFDCASVAPRIWFSLTSLPGGKDLSELESLAFSVDDLNRMVSQSAMPVVLFSKAGYLVLSDFGDQGQTSFRVWVFLPAPLWNELRERRRLSVRDLVISTWGYCDAVQALAERSRYSSQYDTFVSAR